MYVHMFVCPDVFKAEATFHCGFDHLEALLLLLSANGNEGADPTIDRNILSAGSLPSFSNLYVLVLLLKKDHFSPSIFVPLCLELFV